MYISVNVDLRLLIQETAAAIVGDHTYTTYRQIYNLKRQINRVFHMGKSSKEQVPTLVEKKLVERVIRQTQRELKHLSSEEIARHFENVFYIGRIVREYPQQ